MPYFRRPMAASLQQPIHCSNQDPNWLRRDFGSIGFAADRSSSVARFIPNWIFPEI